MDSFGDSRDEDASLLLGDSHVDGADSPLSMTTRNFWEMNDSSDSSSLFGEGTCYANDEISFEKREADDVAVRKLVLVSVTCTLFMFAELIGGYLADSLAIMTDAAHLLSDIIGFVVSLLSIWIGRKKPTNYMTFGYERTQVLGALISILVIWILAGAFCILAIRRLWLGEYEINANVMLIVSSLGLVVNIIMAIILHGSCFGNHLHGVSLTAHSHEENINVRAATAHVIGDILQSLGVLFVAVILKFSPSAKVLDPVCTIIFSVIVVCVTAKVAKDSFTILLQSSPMDINYVLTILKRIDGVKRVHSVRMWTLIPGNNILTAHLVIDEFCDRDAVLRQALTVVNKRLDVGYCCLQMEKQRDTNKN